MRFYLFMAIFLTLCCSKLTYAYTCTFDSTPFNIDAGTIYVDPNLKPGEKIGDVITGSAATLLRCTNTSDITSEMLMVTSYGVSNGSPVAYDGRIIYETGIPGVGFAVGTYSSSCGQTGWAKVSSGSMSGVVCSKTNGPIATNILVQPQIQLYRTSYASPTGTMASKMVGGIDIAINGSPYPASGSNVAKINLAVTVKVLTCTVTSPNINVNMGKVKASAFSGRLTAGGDVQDFNIGLKCSVNTPISVQIDGTNPANKSLGILRLTDATNVASGVGLQILDGTGTTPVRLGTAISAGSKSGTIFLPYKARYYQIANSIEPGVANATATFTITYK